MSRGRKISEHQWVVNYPLNYPAPTHMGAIPLLEKDFWKNTAAARAAYQHAQPPLVVTDATNYVGIGHFRPPMCPWETCPPTFLPDYRPNLPSFIHHEELPLRKWYSLGALG